MSTFSCTAQGYSGNDAYGVACMGTSTTGGDAKLCTVRYAFTTDASGASSFSFRTGAVRLAVNGMDVSAESVAEIRFALTTDAAAYRNKKGNYGHGYSDYQSCRVGAALQSRSIAQKLLPNTTYYLWLFPGAAFASYTRFDLGGCSVTTAGSYGRPSTVSLPAEGLFGSPLELTLSRSLSGVRHTVTVQCAGRTETLAENSDAYPSLSWTPDLAAYAAALPASDSAVATVTVRTFYDGADWGSSSAQTSLRFPATALNPAVSAGWVRLEPYNTGAAAGMSAYVSGYSRARAVFDSTKIDMSGSYGATIAAYTLTAAGETAASAAAEGCVSPVLTDQTVLTAAVVDSRGHRAEAEFTLTPLDYAPPTLSRISVLRCDPNGTESEDGACVKVRADLSYSALAGENSVSLTVCRRTAQGDFGPAQSLTPGADNILTGFDPDRSYVLRLEAADTLGNGDTVLRSLPTRRWAMKFSAGADAVAFGKAPEQSAVLEIPAGWRILRGSATALFTDDPAWTDLLARVAALEGN